MSLKSIHQMLLTTTDRNKSGWCNGRNVVNVITIKTRTILGVHQCIIVYFNVTNIDFCRPNTLGKIFAPFI